MSVRLALQFHLRVPEAATRGVLYKKLLLEISQLESLFYKETPIQVFPCEYFSEVF